MSPKLLVIINEPDTTAALFGNWIEDEGVELLNIHAYRGDAVPDEVTPVADGLLVLGGSMNCQADDQAPWLPAVRALMKRSYEQGVPTLGICLGGQLLSVALGGEVKPSDHGVQVGTYELAPVADLKDDLIFNSITGAVHAAQWHVDEIVRLPAGAVHLMGDAEFPHQAFRLGQTCWGVQFHPEIDDELMAQWSTPSSMAGMPKTPEQAISQTAAARAELHRTWEPVARAFARLLTPDNLGSMQRALLLSSRDGAK